MRSNCEVCGREIGFFERSLKIENTRLGLVYDNLCPACHNSVTHAIGRIDDICMAMNEELRGDYSKYHYASGDVDTLIFLAVKVIFEYEPDFADPQGILAEVFYPDDHISVRTKFDYLSNLVFKVLRSGFASVLGRYGLDAYDAFIGYMHRKCYFIEQQRCNCGPDSEVVYADIFADSAGMVFLDTENMAVKTLYAGSDRRMGYEESQFGATYDLTIRKFRFKGSKEQPVIFFNRKDQCTDLARKLRDYNNAKSSRIESELDALISNLNVTIEKDLRGMHPDDNISDIPLDSVLVSIIKTLFEQDISQEYVKEAPDGILSLIVERCYMDNFIRSGFSEMSDINEYINDYCRFVDGFDAAFSSQDELRPAFAFLTPKAYLIKPLHEKGAFMRGKVELPNDLYCDYQYMIFQGKKEFYITSSTSDRNEEGYYFLTGVRINAKSKKPLDALESYFGQKALEYYQYQMELEDENNDILREREISNQARRVFAGYGYLPFCIYDEWAQIEHSLRKSDLLMQTLIPERKAMTGTNDARIFYAGRTVNTFEQQASSIAESLDIKKLPVARGLLWKALKKEIVDICSKEFIRLAGDIAEPTDSIEDAFLRYSSLTGIQTEKAYYFGLYIYYLMSKGILDNTDFLDHYDRAAKVYIKLNPGHKRLEFSELSVPKHKAFDSESFDFTKFNVEVTQEQEVAEEVVELDPFIYSVRQDAQDLDTADELARRLNEELNPVNMTMPEIELLSDLILQGTTLVYEESSSLDNQAPTELKIDNPNTEIFRGVEFIDSNNSEIDDQNDADEKREDEYEEKVLGIKHRKNPARRLGFDSVRTIVGVTHGKREP